MFTLSQDITGLLLAFKMKYTFAYFLIYLLTYLQWTGQAWIGMWCIIKDLVLFVCSVQPSCKFLWLLGLYSYIQKEHRVAWVPPAVLARS